MKGIVVIGHGSRSKEATEVFFRTVEAMKSRLNLEVEGGFMELATPDIPSAIDNLYKKGVRDITVLPYFLYTGIHIKEDIPEILQSIKENYNDINIQMAEPIGFHELLVDILVERAQGVKRNHVS